MGLIIGLYIVTLRYKRELRKSLDKKKHKFVFFYGIGMFLVDMFCRKLIKKKGYWDRAIKKLNVKEDISKEKYLYVVEKVAISILVLSITFFVGAMLSINERNQGKTINSVTRNAQHNLMVENSDGETKQITLDVPERKLNEKEKEQILNKAEDNLLRDILGENESIDNVCHNLNLVNSIGEEGVLVSWSIEDTSIISYEGVIGKDISSEGKLVKLEATLILEEMIRQCSFFVNVFPNKDEKDTAEYLQEYVEENDVSNQEVILPDTINGANVRYYNSVESLSGVIVVIGIFLAAALFFMKDKDLEKEVKERNKQMMKDYPEIVSKILLFYGAGLSIKMTFEEIVKEYEIEKKKDAKIFKYAYEEMIITLNKMKTGIPDKMAINEYGKRCGLHSYVKLANIIEQNLKRGTREITYALKEELSNVMNDRKNNGMKEGNEISTKLLGPMLMMLMVTIVIVIVPAFMSMNF